MSEESVIAGTSNTLKTLVDGSVRLQVTFDPRDRGNVMELFGEPGTPIACARLTQEAAQHDAQKQMIASNKGEWGEQAKLLHQSGFFRAPPVWKALGTDEDFQEWCRNQVCVICGKQDYVEKTGEMLCEYAHVRRSNSSGTGFKAEYSGVPMCHDHHTKQHQHGGAYVYNSKHGESVSKEAAKNWFDIQVIARLEKWAHESLVWHFEVDSLTQLDPIDLISWCKENSLIQFLPNSIKEIHDECAHS